MSRLAQRTLGRRPARKASQPDEGEPAGAPAPDPGVQDAEPAAGRPRESFRPLLPPSDGPPAQAPEDQAASHPEPDAAEKPDAAVEPESAEVEPRSEGDAQDDAGTEPEQPDPDDPSEPEAAHDPHDPSEPEAAHDPDDPSEPEAAHDPDDPSEPEAAEDSDDPEKQAPEAAEEPSPPDEPKPSTPAASGSRAGDTVMLGSVAEPLPGADTLNEPPSRRERGRARRRLRYLRRLHELQLRDLGGLVYDLYRFGEKRDPLVRSKLDALDSTERQSNELNRLVDEQPSTTHLRHPGVGTCPRCRTLFTSDANFCLECGLPLRERRTREPDPEFNTSEWLPAELSGDTGVHQVIRPGDEGASGDVERSR